MTAGSVLVPDGQSNKTTHTYSEDCFDYIRKVIYGQENVQDDSKDCACKHENA